MIASVLARIVDLARRRAGLVALLALLLTARRVLRGYASVDRHRYRQHAAGRSALAENDRALDQAFRRMPICWSS